MLAFGTDGIRGRWGSSPFNQQGIRRMGEATAALLADQTDSRLAVIAGDTRPSTPEISDSLKEILCARGFDVRDLGVAPSPALAFMTAHYNAAVGIMVSASHNPWQDNGVKFFSPRGTKVSAAFERRLEKCMQAPNPGPPTIRGEITRGNILPYLDMVNAKKTSLKNRRLVIDCANGANYQLANHVFSDTDCQAIYLNIHPSGQNINHDCGVIAPLAAQQAVVQHNADMGIIFDGDGDRLLLVDHSGTLVNGDGILYLLASSTSTPGVIGTVMSNHALETAVIQMGKIFRRTSVGDRHVLMGLQEERFDYGSEPSGHIISMRDNPTGDALLAALLVLQLMERKNQSLAELTAGYHPVPQLTYNLRAKRGTPGILKHPVVAGEIERQQQRLCGRGRILVRRSGTEPLVRIMVESESSAENQSIAQKIAQAIGSVYSRH